METYAPPISFRREVFILTIENGLNFGDQLRKCKNCRYRLSRKGQSKEKVFGSRCEIFDRVLRRESTCSKHKVRAKARVDNPRRKRELRTVKMS